MTQRGVSLAQSNDFSFDIDDGIITIRGDLSSDQTHISNLLHNNNKFKVLNDDMRIGVMQAVMNALYQQSELGKKNSDMLNRFGYFCDTKSITWTDFIPIQKVVINGEIHDVDVDGLRQSGYGVSSFKIPNCKLMTSYIKCVGNHPNLNDCGELCTGTLETGNEITIDALNSIHVMLTVANMDSCYYTVKHMEKIKPHIR